MESTGKYGIPVFNILEQSGMTPLLVQCALAAVKSTRKDPYFRSKYETLKKRCGHKKAIAIAGKMLVAIYHMIRNNADFPSS